MVTPPPSSPPSPVAASPSAPPHAPASADALRQRAEAVAARLPPLLVAAERVAATVAQGVHGRRRAGVGEAFWQYRRYTPGDSVARIDWRQSARGRHTYIRETEWEAAQSVWIWRDTGPGMNWRSDPALPTKRQRADLLALALACLLIRGGERVGLLDTASPTPSPEPERPAEGRGGLERLALRLDAEAKADRDAEAKADRSTETKADRNGAETPAFTPLPRHAHLVLLGDFLDPIADIRQRLTAHAAAGARGHLLQILDPAEETLPYSGRVEFQAVGHQRAGGRRSLTVPRVDALRDAYRQRLAEQRDELARLAASLGWTLGGHRTDRPPHQALLSLWGQVADTPLSPSGISASGASASGEWA